MDFVKNFNGLELVFIVILAILLFGPEKIPDIASKLGVWVRKLRNLSSKFMEMLDEEAGLSEITEEASKITSSLNQPAIDVNLRGQIRQRSKEPIPEKKGESAKSKAAVKDSSGTLSSQTELKNRLRSLEKELQQIRAELADQDSEKASTSDE